MYILIIRSKKNNPTIYNLLTLYLSWILTLFSSIILCITCYLVLPWDHLANSSHIFCQYCDSCMWPENNATFTSRWKSWKQMLGVRLLDAFWETAMFCNMCGITSYFPWQQIGQYFKQTMGEKILGIVSDDFWILLNIFFWCRQWTVQRKGGWWMTNHGKIYI